MPAAGMIEVEFQTWNNSFPYDLGWSLQTFETHEFACLYEATFPGTPQCQVITGTTIKPVFFQFFGFSSDVTAGTARWLWIPAVLNGEYAGFTPYLTFRTKDADGVTLEEKAFTLPTLVELPDPTSGYGFSATTQAQDSADTDMALACLCQTCSKTTAKSTLPFRAATSGRFRTT